MPAPPQTTYNSHAASPVQPPAPSYLDILSELQQVRLSSATCKASCASDMLLRLLAGELLSATCQVHCTETSVAVATGTDKVEGHTMLAARLYGNKH